MIVKAHHHFWKPDRSDYGWLSPELTILYREFLPGDLAPLFSRNGVGRTILVQAAPPNAETEFLLSLADETPSALGVVGWVDFAGHGAADDIARQAKHPKPVGLRPMIQGIPDDDWMLDPRLTSAFDAMVKHNLIFDTPALPRHLPRLRLLLQRHPQLQTVADHGAQPDLAPGAFDIWANDIALIAQDSDAYCTLPGLLTDAGEDWARSDITPTLIT
ncbi:putative metal-dependent hydrolase of the TIM-barrel fold protein [Phaeobacter porticola]|uniref:Putative metal-dependent hydrolase of the TIM-barrel fold protein n=1 Tax=Phaeobacter porticola TaxID=1844006 RepID=A0A1L3I3N6_9RHOB|nr:amidohydrolase family protein [Phaeobacter porticola]APG46721.1 putative metal-dependent hydrolase of the TIM-barrel fold protein [Phaeobacter porticola]